MQTHLKRRGDNVADDVTVENLRELAFDTQKYSGAAIANLVNVAAMRVERDGRDKIKYKDLTDVSRCPSHDVSTHFASGTLVACQDTPIPHYHCNPCKLPSLDACKIAQQHRLGYSSLPRIGEPDGSCHFLKQPACTANRHRTALCALLGLRHL